MIWGFRLFLYSLVWTSLSSAVIKHAFLIILYLWICLLNDLGVLIIFIFPSLNKSIFSCHKNRTPKFFFLIFPLSMVALLRSNRAPLFSLLRFLGGGREVFSCRQGKIPTLLALRNISNRLLKEMKIFWNIRCVYFQWQFGKFSKFSIHFMKRNFFENLEKMENFHNFQWEEGHLIAFLLEISQQE